MLDTNICIYCINERPKAIANKLAVEFAYCCISAITLAELYFGAANSINSRQSLFEVNDFISRITVLPFDELAAIEYGQVRYQLSKNGTLIGANDLLIASHAIAKHLTLVTNNEKEFIKVHSLNVINWMND
jgi:tRNA(fMet)-specific endonuclease VapC